ncbi:MAG: DUF2280 domain-containing protein [Blastocatellia bacterium]
MAGKKKLIEEEQVFIVKCLATYMSPTEVVEAVKEEFSIEISRQLVRKYNPLQTPDIAEKWKVIFEETRKKFKEDLDACGIAHQSYRLRELEKLYHQAGSNKVLKAQLLKQAAEERGGAYTSKREIILDAKESLARLLGVSPDQLPTPGKK